MTEQQSILDSATNHLLTHWPLWDAESQKKATKNPETAHAEEMRKRVRGFLADVLATQEEHTKALIRDMNRITMECFEQRVKDSFEFGVIQGRSEKKEQNR